MSYSKQYVESLSSKHHFLKGNFEKLLRLLEAIDFISSDPFLAPRLVPKGGTAIHLIYAGLPRLSVDIDLDYIGSFDLKETQKERLKILNLMERHLTSNGYSLSPEGRSYFA
ncbi:MAG: hypothetical protein BWY98_00917 [Tenericutes bacterium ADurb.BinA155]|jgi:hypothetical protein|nr:MAG: hypothetical protein BWY98_00917 [Tenericutes bacterium ADurb.BinA155]